MASLWLSGVARRTVRGYRPSLWSPRHSSQWHLPVSLAHEVTSSRRAGQVYALS